MSLLTDIIDGASGDVPVSTLLRKFKVLAVRTGTDRLAEWVGQELEGYPDAQSTPSYRGPFEPLVLGHFVGIANEEIRNVQIPPATFPEDMRDGHLFKLWLMGPVAEIEALAQSETGPQFSWPPDGVMAYNVMVNGGTVQRIVREDMVLVQVVRPLARSYVVGVLDSVRTRILDLALELEQVAPNVGEPEAPAEQRGNAQQVINHYNFHGDTSNVAIGSTNVNQTVALPRRGDEQGLLRYLAAAGVRPRELLALEQAIAADRSEAGEGELHEPGSRVLAWMRHAATQVGTGASAGLVVEAIKAFFGS